MKFYCCEELQRIYLDHEFLKHISSQQKENSQVCMLRMSLFLSKQYTPIHPSTIYIKCYLTRKYKIREENLTTAHHSDSVHALENYLLEM